MKKKTIRIIKEVAKQHLREYLTRQHHPKGTLGNLKKRRKIEIGRTQQPLGGPKVQIRYKH